MEEKSSFEDLGLDEATLLAVAKKGFTEPSPIQVLAIPRLLEGETNLIAKARTGTGKTAAFGLPLVQTIREQTGNVQALILAPTRELAMQVCREIESFTDGSFPRIVPVYGGASIGPQIKTLRRGVEIVVGTPGRVKDLLHRGVLNINHVSYFILDEADEMLDMGFIDDIKLIFSQANSASRILLFSATMPKPILDIASKFMGDYDIVEEEASPEEPLLTEQRYWFVREQEKIEALVRMIDISTDFYGLIFTQTKADADRITRALDERGYEAAAMHGDIPQAQREKILARFREKKTQILVATDVAARGIDVEGLTHVVNYALPFDGPTYVHRIGRTGRAGSTGLAFTLVCPSERRRLENLKRFALKATKAELKETKIPSVKEVLKVKQNRLFTELKVTLGIKTDDGNGLDQEDVVVSENTPATTTLLDTVKIDETFVSLVDEICETNDAKKVLGAVLQNYLGKSLDESRYGTITNLNDRSPRLSDGQVRIYVQLGRRDGYYPREIAEFFTELLNIPQRMVDQIDCATNFSLVSLPAAAAKKALELSAKNSKVPHMHVDSNAGSGRRGGGNSRGRGGDSRPRGGNSRGRSGDSRGRSADSRGRSADSRGRSADSRGENRNRASRRREQFGPRDTGSSRHQENNSNANSFIKK